MTIAQLVNVLYSVVDRIYLLLSENRLSIKHSEYLFSANAIPSHVDWQ